MTGRIVKWMIATALLAGPAAADLRPVARPAPDVVVLSSRGTIQTPTVSAVARSVRPVGRLSLEDRLALMVAAAIRAPVPVIDTESKVRRSSRPTFRPDDLILAASRTPRRAEANGGGTCGRGSITGTAIPPVVGNGACGIPNPVRVTAVAGVGLSRPTRMNCDVARALDDWVRQGVIPAVGNTGGGIVSLQVAAGYSCRTRNNRAGAKLSEHAKGNAIDISGLTLANGDTVSVLNDWGRGSKGRLLRTLWQRACGPFGTVLGPESDRHHRDHFHFDTAAYRSGPYCR